jgi:hypothetical protein
MSGMKYLNVRRLDMPLWFSGRDRETSDVQS